MMGRNWDWMFPIGDKPDYAPSPNESVGARARAAGRSPEDLAYDLLLEKDGKALLYFTAANFYEGKLDALGDLLRDPSVVLGLGDGGAHYGIVCDASYPYLPADLLGSRSGRASASRPPRPFGC